MSKKPPTWAYGVTTVPQRIDSHLPRTLQSLKAAGFPKPRLFVDNCQDTTDYLCFDLEITNHWPCIRTAGNWILSLYELYIRQPDGKYFAIFQDDFVTSVGLREYLEWCKYPEKGYWNLYTFPVNQVRANGKTGWFLSNQMGKGAVALIFSLEAVEILLGTPYIMKRFPCPKRGHRAIDGGVVDCFKAQGWKEYCHSPSLVQHTGDESSMGNNNQQKANSFCGESMNLMDLTNPN